jgi:serine/threonine protein kinase
MEFMPNGNLLQYVQRNAATLTVDDRLSLCADIINGLCYLHGKRPAPIIHRDLKVRYFLRLVIIASQRMYIYLDICIHRISPAVSQRGD